MKKVLLILATLVFLLPTAAPASPLSVDVILSLLDAGVSDVSIQRYVERNRFTFELSADDLKALKKAGASDTLVEFLQDREEGAPSGTSGDQAGPAEDSGAVQYSTPEYGVSTYAPSSWSFGVSLGYPYYYYDSYYPYYYPYYYRPYYPYYYPYYGHSHYYGGGHYGGGSGVVSYWGHNHSGRGGGGHPGASPPPPAPRSSPHGGRSGGHGGGGHGRH